MHAIRAEIRHDYIGIDYTWGTHPDSRLCPVEQTDCIQPWLAESPQIQAGVAGNPIQGYTDLRGSDLLAESIRRIGSASDSDPPPDQFY